MSAHIRGPVIVALILTILVFPIVKHGHVIGHGKRQGATYTLKCRLGKPIPDTPLAKRIGVAGHTCHHVITRYVKLPKQPK